MKNTYLTKISLKEFQKQIIGSQESLKSNNVFSYFSSTLEQIDTFVIGKYFWFIADVTKFQNLYAGGMIEEMISIKRDQFIGGPPDLLFSNCFPDDLEKMLSFSQYYTNYCSNMTSEERKNIRATIFIRLMSPLGHYYWAMVQYLDTIFTNDGKLLYMLTLLTDVSHLKKNGDATMTILDSRNMQSQLFLCLDGSSPVSQQVIPKISTRELEVLSWIIKGASSKQIADKLYIAKKTVDNHRQNLLFKTNSKTTGELVAFALTNGFI